MGTLLSSLSSFTIHSLFFPLKNSALFTEQIWKISPSMTACGKNGEVMARKFRMLKLDVHTKASAPHKHNETSQSCGHVWFDKQSGRKRTLLEFPHEDCTSDDLGMRAWARSQGCLPLEQRLYNTIRTEPAGGNVAGLPQCRETQNGDDFLATPG